MNYSWSGWWLSHPPDHKKSSLGIILVFGLIIFQIAITSWVPHALVSLVRGGLRLSKLAHLRTQDPESPGVLRAQHEEHLCAQNEDHLCIQNQDRLHQHYHKTSLI